MLLPEGLHNQRCSVGLTFDRVNRPYPDVHLFAQPGKLHAKAAVVDKQALLSSANLTDDAFLRNLELGVLFMGGEMPGKLRRHFDHLISAGTLLRWNP